MRPTAVIERRAGLFRTEYEAATLRENLGLQVPGERLSGGNPPDGWRTLTPAAEVRYGLLRRVVSRKRWSRHGEAGRHAAGLGEARRREGGVAGGQAARAARREAAAWRQAAHVGRAAGDRGDVAVARLAVHGRGKEPGGVRV